LVGEKVYLSRPRFFYQAACAAFCPMGFEKFVAAEKKGKFILGDQVCSL